MVESEQDPSYPLVNGMHYLDVLVGIEAVLKPNLYLEIGSRSGTSLLQRNCSFIAIDPVFRLKSAKFKTSSDMLFFQKTSNEFFESDFLSKCGLVPDWAFIDGMHLVENALEDFINCERTMLRTGMICFHDVVPFNGEMTVRDEEHLKVGTGWTGDVWKVVPILKKYRPDLTVDVLNSHRTGICCVHGLDPENSFLKDNFDSIIEEFAPIDLSVEGPDYYFKELDLIDPTAYLADLETRIAAG